MLTSYRLGRYVQHESTVSGDAKKESSDTGTRTQVSCVKGKYANHLHHIGELVVALVARVVFIV